MNIRSKQDATRGSAMEARLGVEELFRAHAPYVAGFIRRMGARSHEVDDLVQEVFLVAHQKGGYVSGAARPTTWLSAIAIRLVRSNRRTLARSREDATEHGQLQQRQGGQTPAEVLLVRESLDRVQAALETLDVDSRATFILYELESESCDVIASLLEVPVGTVYSRLHYARRKFLEAYESQESGYQEQRTSETACDVPKIGAGGSS